MKYFELKMVNCWVTIYASPLPPLSLDNFWGFKYLAGYLFRIITVKFTIHMFAASSSPLLQVVDADTGENGEIETVSIISARSSKVTEDVRKYFNVRLTTHLQNGEYQLEVAKSLAQLGNQVWFAYLCFLSICCRDWGISFQGIVK